MVELYSLGEISKDGLARVIGNLATAPLGITEDESFVARRNLHQESIPPSDHRIDSNALAFPHPADLSLDT